MDSVKYKKMNTTEINTKEIKSLRYCIAELEKDNISMEQRIACNKQQILEMSDSIAQLIKVYKQNEFNYSAVIDGKIDGIVIKSITVDGCPNITCNGLHPISIFCENKSKRINIDNSRHFSITELQELGYDAILRIRVDSDWYDELMRDCALAKKFPKKIDRYSYSN